MLGRIKFQIEPLVNEILDQLPREVWSSKTTTFLDPAMGGGQFVREVERRLREAGHTDANISGRVYGCETSLLSVKYALNKYKLIGTYSVGDFLTQDFGDMKFDVVVGNPPFQSDSLGRAEKLWPKFIAKAFDLAKEKGHVAIISPTSWSAGSKNISKGSTGVLHDYFHKYNIIKIDLNVKSYFPGVGTHIGYFVGNKCPNHGITKINDQMIDLREFDILPSDNNDFDIKLSILKKVFQFKDKFNVVPYTGGGACRKMGTDNKTNTNKIKTYVRGGNLNEVNYAYFQTVQNPKHANKRKVIIPISGAEKFMPFIDDEGVPFSLSSYVVDLDKTDTLEGAISVFYSRLFKFLIQEYRTSGFIQIQIVKNLPKVPMKNKLTDKKLYTLIGLSQEEIDYIEANVK